MTDLISQFIVFLFLIDSDTSLLVTVPSFFGMLIQAWKVRKATGLAIRFGTFGFPVIEFQRWKHHQVDKQTQPKQVVESAQLQQELEQIKEEVEALKVEAVSETKTVETVEAVKTAQAAAQADVLAAEAESDVQEGRLTTVTLEADR